MAKKQHKVVKFNFAQIEVNQFAIIEDVELDDEDLAIKSNFVFNLDDEVKMARCTFKYSFLSKNNPVIILETSIDFKIDPKSFDNLIARPGELVIPKDFATHLAMTTVSTARGILHAKTEGTAYNKYLIPPIDVSKVVAEDLILKET